MNKIENDNLIKLIVDAQNGVEGAFEQLYKETVKSAYSIASLLLSNKEDIEDALQNSYMHVAKGIKDLKNPESFENWLSVIVKHECQKHIAKRKRVTDIFSAVFKSKDFELPVEESLPFDLIERKEISEAVQKIVNSLPDDKRACVALYYFEQNSLSEIAEILGIPEGTVKSRLYSARKILEKEFKKLQKKDDTLFGISLIPLVAAFFAYQLKNISIPASIAEGASVCIASGSTSLITASSAASSASVATGSAAATSATGAAGVAVTTKVAAVAVAAAVVTGGGVAAVNYVENKKEAESTTFPRTSITEEYTTAVAFIQETTLVPDETSTTQKKTETAHKATTNKHTTAKSVTTVASTTVTEKTTRGTTSKKETATTEPTTRKETTQPTTTEIPTTDAVAVYGVSGGILSEYTGDGGNVLIPSSVGGNTVTAIGAGAFAGNPDITSVFVPSTVTRIGQEAFSDCTDLESISLPLSLQSIGIGAFYGCTSLTNVSIPTGVTTIGDDAFADCSSLSVITIPSGVTSIGDNAFGGCDNLTIRCSEVSAAYDYAVENFINYELI